MTRDEMFSKYGNVKVKFTYYYKYSFYYEGITKKGYKIKAMVGGDSSEIYRLEVRNNEEVLITALCPNYCAVYDNNGKIIDKYEEQII